MKKSKKTNVILSETKNLMRSFTFVQDDRESGRSMVEMLGVLAVMGVLSVGGVAMYTNAMNKYRANELLNEGSKRAVVIATQILSGKSISADMMNQFDNNGTTFTGVEVVGTNQFKLTLSGVDDDVCIQLKATVGSNTIIQEVGDKCAYLTFNNDLSKGTSSSNTGGSNGGNEQQEQKTCTEDASICGIWQSCVDGECVCDKSKCQALCPKTGDKCAELYPTAAIGFNINYDNYPEGIVCEGDLSTDTELRLPGGGCWNGALSVAFDGCVCHYDAD